MSNYKRFGVMIDCSRGAVLKVSAVKQMIDFLQKAGYNTLELYTEDTFEVADEPYFGYLRGKYSADEIKEMDAYATAHGIELIPCVQTLAHFTCPVKLPRFAEITDVNDILLIDDEKTYEFIEKLFASLAKNFTSRNVHIGMDEAHMVGLGKYLDKHGYCDRFELLNRHLSRVAQIAQKYGFTPHMWSDMFFRLAAKGEYYTRGVHVPEEVRKKVPESVQLVYWDYYHLQRDMYDDMIAAHSEFSRPLWFAGGAWTWTGFIPHSGFTRATMRPAMESVREHNIEKVLITTWGDNGGECPPFAQLQTLYAIRRYADGEFDEEKIAEKFEEKFGVSASDFDMLELPDTLPDVPLCEITDAEYHPNTAKALLYTDPFMGILDTAIAAHEKIPFAEYAQKLAAAKERAGEYAYLFDTAEKLSLLMELKAYLGVRTRKAYRSGDKKELEKIISDYAETEKRLDEFFEAFSAQWNRINKPFGFEVHCARIGGVKQRLAYCRKRLQEYVAGKTERIEELEEELLAYDPAHPNDLFMNDYRAIVSASEL